MQLHHSLRHLARIGLLCATAFATASAGAQTVLKMAYG